MLRWATPLPILLLGIVICGWYQSLAVSGNRRPPDNAVSAIGPRVDLVKENRPAQKAFLYELLGLLIERQPAFEDWLAATAERGCHWLEIQTMEDGSRLAFTARMATDAQFAYQPRAGRNRGTGSSIDMKASALRYRTILNALGEAGVAGVKLAEYPTLRFSVLRPGTRLEGLEMACAHRVEAQGRGYSSPEPSPFVLVIYRDPSNWVVRSAGGFALAIGVGIIGLLSYLTWAHPERLRILGGVPVQRPSPSQKRSSVAIRARRSGYALVFGGLLVALTWWTKGLIETGFGAQIELWPIITTDGPPLTWWAVNVAAAAVLFSFGWAIHLLWCRQRGIAKWVGVGLLVLIGGRAVAGALSWVNKPEIVFVPVYGTWDAGALTLVYMAALLWASLVAWSMTFCRSHRWNEPSRV